MKSPVAMIKFAFQFISERKNVNISGTQTFIISSLLRKRSYYQSVRTKAGLLTLLNTLRKRLSDF